MNILVQSNPISSEFIRTNKIQSFDSPHITVIECGQLIDGKSKVPIKDAIIVVADDRIAYAGHRESFTFDCPINKVIDLSQCTVLPGLIDCHFNALEIQNYKLSHNRNRNSYIALKALSSLQNKLYVGWTTVRLIGLCDYIHLDIKKIVDEGLFKSPRIITSSHPISSTGGGADSDFGNIKSLPKYGIADGIDEIIKIVREEVKHGSQWVMMVVNGMFRTTTNPKLQYFSDEEIDALIEQSSRLMCPVMALAHTASSIKTAILAGSRSIEYGSFIDDAGIKLMYESETFLVPLLHSANLASKKSDDLSYFTEKMKIQRDSSIRNAIEAGVKIAIGTGFYNDNTMSDHIMEFIELKRLGMTEMDTIISATSVASELLGIDSMVGTIEVGKMADIIAVKGDPLTDLQCLKDIIFVMSQGTIVKFNREMIYETANDDYFIVSTEIQNSKDHLQHLSSSSSLISSTSSDSSSHNEHLKKEVKRARRDIIYPWKCKKCATENFAWSESCLKCDSFRPGVQKMEIIEESEMKFSSMHRYEMKRTNNNQDSIEGSPSVLHRIYERRNRRRDGPY